MMWITAEERNDFLWLLEDYHNLQGKLLDEIELIGMISSDYNRTEEVDYSLTEAADVVDFPKTVENKLEDIRDYVQLIEQPSLADCSTLNQLVMQDIIFKAFESLVNKHVNGALGIANGLTLKYNEIQEALPSVARNRCFTLKEKLLDGSIITAAFMWDNNYRFPQGLKVVKGTIDDN